MAILDSEKAKRVANGHAAKSSSKHYELWKRIKLR